MYWPSMRTRTWEPWSELDRLQGEMSRLFGRTAGESGGIGDFPAVNIWTGEDRAVLTAELPGIDLADLDLSVKNDTVTIRGSRQTETLVEGQAYLRQERGTGSFVRSFALPFRVDAGKVTARYERGILSLTLPRAEEDKPKRIAVHAG